MLNFHRSLQEVRDAAIHTLDPETESEVQEAIRLHKLLYGVVNSRMAEYPLYEGQMRELRAYDFSAWRTLMRERLSGTNDELLDQFRSCEDFAVVDGDE